ncbi:Ig-like domain-containing protein [Natrinema sp. 1APR25-10V2]|uniref:Ig-like domain-containing protein n=1 Tax=Natrinema sp. 1APR25-10V2 TaxID=2951081 RepID=UPI00287631B8|nr:Ig-like domain-containing protein [Natrinema sp. 1APR25-10V2]MDS0474460.1 Ig-like domain-containing protein [Natrinema sp. 1APR25-10V2]
MIGTSTLDIVDRRSADRAVSPVIGAILMFGLVLALLATLQLTAIPALNEGLEFQHNDRVQSDVVGVDGTIERVAATGTGEAVSLEAGLRYPPRLFFVNPPPVSGTVRTTEPAAVGIANARATGETGDYWNGSPRTVETRSLEYVPDYNEYASAPRTVLEPWVAYHRFAETTRVEGDQDLVDGRRIGLVALEGNRSVSRTDEISIDVEPASAPVRTVAVRDDGDPVTLTVPTRLTEDEWGDLLADELDPAGDPDDDRYVREFDCQRESPDPCGRLTITLERGATYELRLGAVAVGSGTEASNAAYLTDVDGDATAVPEAGRQRLVVEARDRFDNPVSGVAVTGSVGGDGTVRAVEPITDADGRATFVYDAPDDVDRTQDVDVTLRFGENARQTVTFDVRVMDLGDGGSSSGTTEPTATITDVTSNTGGSQDRYTVSTEARDSGGDLERLEFELRNHDTDTVIDTATATISGGSDAATAALRARSSERLAAYRIVATAVDSDGNAGSDERLVSGS